MAVEAGPSVQPSASVAGVALIKAWALAFGLLGSGFFCSPAFAQGEAGNAPLEISFAFVSPIDLPVKGVLLLRPPDGKGEPMQLDVASTAPLSVRLPTGSTWEASAEIPGFWVRRQPVVIGSVDQVTRLTLDLWPLGQISGVLKVKEKKDPLPKVLQVQTVAAPAFAKRPMGPKGALDCPVDAEGNWSCSLPAATYDLMISAKGLTPHYRWGVQVPAGKMLPLGTVALERGASVSGWVAVEGGAIADDCVARLSPLVAGGADLKSVGELGRTAREQPVRKDGFLQLTGLAPGNYLIEVEQPGYPPARVSPVKVDPGAETFLREPVVLRRPIELQFDVHPPVDWLGKAWSAKVVRRADRPPSPLVFEGAVAETGRFTVPGQSVGRFRVTIEDSLGSSLYSGEHQVDSPDPAPQPIHLSFVTVAGQVRLGEEPIAATLWFGGRSGAVSARMESDGEGQFHGVLPREGLWRIEVKASEPAFSTWAQAEVDAGRSGRATVNIVLPDTRIFGHVVDEQGKRVARADVIVQAERLNLFAVSDEMGRFEARGLPEGLVWLGAERSESVSNRAYANLVEGSSVGPIELRLHQSRKVAGTVFSRQGPVAGSRVTLLAGIAEGVGATGLTDISGKFEIGLPKEVTRLQAIVGAPGFPLQAFDALAAGEPLALRVTEEMGDLAFTLPPGDELMRKNLILVAYQNGHYIPATVLNQWAYDQGEDVMGADDLFRVPRVAAGQYAVCFVPQQLPPSFLMGSVPVGAGCDSGSLAPGATLFLKPSLPD